MQSYKLSNGLYICKGWIAGTYTEMTGITRLSAINKAMNSVVRTNYD